MQKLQTLQDLKNLTEEQASSVTPQICLMALQSFQESVQISTDNGGSSVYVFFLLRLVLGFFSLCGDSNKGKPEV